MNPAVRDASPRLAERRCIPHVSLPLFKPENPRTTFLRIYWGTEDSWRGCARLAPFPLPLHPFVGTVRFVEAAASLFIPSVRIGTVVESECERDDDRKLANRRRPERARRSPRRSTSERGEGVRESTRRKTERRRKRDGETDVSCRRRRRDEIEPPATHVAETTERRRSGRHGPHGRSVARETCTVLGRWVAA